LRVLGHSDIDVSSIARFEEHEYRSEPTIAGKRMSEIEVEKVEQRHHGEGGGHSEGEREQDQVISVNAQCALPELCPQSGPGLCRLPDIVALQAGQGGRRNLPRRRRSRTAR